MSSPILPDTAHDASSLETFATDKLHTLMAKAERRVMATTDRSIEADKNSETRVLRTEPGQDPQKMISFCCNDYLGLSQHVGVKKAASEAALRYGAGSGASRLVTGNHPLLDDLEKQLADIKGTEAAVVFGSGYLANLGIVPVLAGKGDLILVDALAHACLFAGASLSAARAITFNHNDTDHIEYILENKRNDYGRVLILTDGVFSMDGDLAPLPDLAALAMRYDAWLMSDDAHGIGILGGGKGSLAHWGLPPEAVPLQMGTLSKAVGSYGGYLCASQAVVDLIKTRARPLIYSTGLPPASAAASLAALDIILANPERCARPIEKAHLFCDLAGLSKPQSCIVPFILGSSQDALDLSEELRQSGFLISAIRPPTVPQGSARLRFTFSSEHDDEDIKCIAEIIKSYRLQRTLS